MFKFIDFHCDTLMHGAATDAGFSLHENRNTSIDFARMKKAGSLAQFFAIFLPTDEMYLRHAGKVMDDDEYIDRLVSKFHQEIDEWKDIIGFAGNYNDILENENQGKMSGILTIEDGRSVGGKLEKLKTYYEKGVRLIGLTWNFENCFGYPNSGDISIMEKGLKKFGREAVQYMNELGMIIDVSHLSDGGFYDVAKISNKPFIASHSNAREISPHKRNLTDDMIRLLGEKGGIAGINFAPQFLNPDTTNDNSTIELMVMHLNHMKNIGGEDIVALGSDFDGIEGNLQVDSVEKIPQIFGALKKSGWNENQIEKFAYANAIRVIKETM